MNKQMDKVAGYLEDAHRENSKKFYLTAGSVCPGCSGDNFVYYEGDEDDFTAYAEFGIGDNFVEVDFTTWPASIVECECGCTYEQYPDEDALAESVYEERYNERERRGHYSIAWYHY